MPRGLSRLLARVHEPARAGKVRFTHKALRELASLDFGLDESDALDILTNLTAEEWVGRAECVVISFHEEGRGRDKEEQW